MLAMVVFEAIQIIAMAGVREAPAVAGHVFQNLGDVAGRLVRLLHLRILETGRL